MNFELSAIYSYVYGRNMTSLNSDIWFTITKAFRKIMKSMSFPSFFLHQNLHLVSVRII